MTSLLWEEYAPDQPPLAGVAAVADNVLPGPNGYRPVPGFAAFPGAALPGYPLGAASFISASRAVSTFAGTAAGLFTYSTAGWRAAGTGYAGSDDNPWAFVQFGQWVIASNGSDAPQYFILDVSATFAPLPGITNTATPPVTVNPPRMKLLAIVRDFVVGGVIDGDATTAQWSGINNASEWRPSYGQSDYQTFPDGGAITAIAGGEYGLVLQEESIRRMTYVGGNVIFQFDVISPNVGCIHARSFTQIGRMSFFLSARGFMQCDGNSVTPIGDEKVDRTFLAAMDRGYMGRMSCVADPVRKVVYWTVPAADPGVWFAYSWAQQRWSRVVAAGRLLVPGRTRDISLDEDAAPPDTFDEGLPFDDPSYRGGDQTFTLFDGTNAYGALTGPPMAAVLSTPLMEPVPGQTMRVRRVRPLTDAISGMGLTLDARARLGDDAGITSRTEFTTEGDMPILARGRFMAATVTHAAGAAWTFDKGVDVDGRPEGGRR